MGTAQLTIVLLTIIGHGLFVCSSPLNYSDKEGGDAAIVEGAETMSNSTSHVNSFQCILGFVVDNLSNKCRLDWNIAGKAKNNETLTVLCPANYAFDIESKSCVSQPPQPSMISGTPNSNQDVTIPCPADFVFDILSNSCALQMAPVKVIDVPIVCAAGSQFDGRSKCRQEW